MRKKNTALVIGIVLISAFVLAIPVIAQENNVISIGDVEVSPGGSETTPILIHNATNVATVRINLSYDPSVVNVTNAEKVDFDEWFAFDNTHASDGYVIIAAIKWAGLSGDRTVANVELTAVGSAGRSSNLNISIIELSDDGGLPIEGSTSNGTFNIEGVAAPTIVSYTISNETITPPQTTEIDVEFSERVEAWIKIEDLNRDLVKAIYHSPGVTNPDPKPWDGKNTTGVQVPDDDYYVNVTGLNTTTGLSVTNNTEIITVQTVEGPTTTITKRTPEPNEAGWNKETVMLSFLRVDNSGTGINYTNLSATPSVTVNISNATAGVYANNTELNAAGYLVDSSFGKTFDVTISNECDTTISYYTVDNASNTEVAKDVTVRIDRTPPASVSNLDETAVGCTWINWTWTNPSDSDFSHVMVYSGLGVHEADVYGAPGEMSYINTSDYCTFYPDTPYEIGTRTVDIAGNVNLIWVNDTATTSEDEEQPVISDLQAVPDTSVNNPTTVSATVTDNVGLSEVYLFVINGDDMILRLHNITDTNVNNVYSGTWDATQLGLTNGTITEMPVTTIKEYEEYAVLGSYQKNQTVPEEDAVAVFYSDYHLKGIYTMENDELLEIEPGNSTFMVYNINVSEEELVNGTTFMIDDRAEFKLVEEAVSDGTYAVGIHAMDFAENENADETDVPVDNTPPNIVGVPSASSITTNSATITWTTNEASNSVVEYGKTTAYGDAESDEDEMVTSHIIDLTGLSAGTTYHYRVKSTDAANNPVVSGDYTFTTESVRRGGGGGGAPRGDSDGDGISDIDEMLAGTDKDDPCDPDPECAACKALAPTPTPTPTAAPTAEPTAKPTTPPVPTAEPTAEPTPTEEPGFEAAFAIAGLLAVAYLVLRRKSK